MRLAEPIWTFPVLPNVPNEVQFASSDIWQCLKTFLAVTAVGRGGGGIYCQKLRRIVNLPQSTVSMTRPQVPVPIMPGLGDPDLDQYRAPCGCSLGLALGSLSLSEMNKFMAGGKDRLAQSWDFLH